MSEKKVTITISLEELELILQQLEESLRTYNRQLSYLGTIAGIVAQYDGTERTEVISLLGEMCIEKEVEIKEKIHNLMGAINEARNNAYTEVEKQKGGQGE